MLENQTPLFHNQRAVAIAILATASLLTVFPFLHMPVFQIVACFLSFLLFALSNKLLLKSLDISLMIDYQQQQHETIRKTLVGLDSN